MKRVIEDLSRQGLLREPQAELLTRVYGRGLLSVYWELRMLLYGGILVFTTGLGLLIHKNLTSFGHAALLGCIGAGFLACLAYCFSHGGGFTSEARVSPNAAYDYVLFLGCLLLGIGLTYGELRYHPLGQRWDLHLLASGLLYLAFAHYFDNRLVVSLALSTLGAWMGVKTSLLHPETMSTTLRVDALVFGAVVVAAGALQDLAGWKRHFLGVHLHLGANLILGALAAGVFDERAFVHAGLLAVAAAVCIAYGLRSRQFALLLYGAGYGYVGFSALVLLRGNLGVIGITAYFLVSSLTVLLALAALYPRLRGRP